MKNSLLIATMLLAFISLQSFIPQHTPVGQKSTIENSKVVWKGYKVGGSHEGTIDLKSGHLSFEGDKLVGGEFVMDMASIACTDLSGDYKGKLEGHLRSDDFFGTDKYPTASLKITKAKNTGKNAYKLKGNLTIKGITKSVKFQASVYGKKATASIKVDRTDFNVKYGSGSFFSGLKDNMIYDEFDLVIDLEF